MNDFFNPHTMGQRKITPNQFEYWSQTKKKKKKI